MPGSFVPGAERREQSDPLDAAAVHSRQHLAASRSAAAIGRISSGTAGDSAGARWCCARARQSPALGNVCQRQSRAPRPFRRERWPDMREPVCLSAVSARVGPADDERTCACFDLEVTRRRGCRSGNSFPRSLDPRGPPSRRSEVGLRPGSFALTGPEPRPEPACAGAVGIATRQLAEYLDEERRAQRCASPRDAPAQALLPERELLY